MLSVVEWWGLPDPEKVRLIEVIQARHSDEPWYSGFFHEIKTNPHVLDCFVRHVNQRRLLGKARISHKYAVEEMRAQGIQMRNKQPFNLNNNYTTDIARLVMLLFPADLGGVFRLRKRTIGEAA